MYKKKIIRESGVNCIRCNTLVLHLMSIHIVGLLCKLMTYIGSNSVILARHQGNNDIGSMFIMPTRC